MPECGKCFKQALDFFAKKNYDRHGVLSTQETNRACLPVNVLCRQCGHVAL